MPASLMLRHYAILLPYLRYCTGYVLALIVLRDKFTRLLLIRQRLPACDTPRHDSAASTDAAVTPREADDDVFQMLCCRAATIIDSRHVSLACCCHALRHDGADAAFAARCDAA